jgi:hypothetical protein
MASTQIGTSDARAEPRRWSQTTTGLAGGALALLIPLTMLVAPESEFVVVVGPRGADTAQVARIVAEAGGSIVGGAGAQHVLIARSDRDDFVRRLYGAGARFVLDGRLARACGTAPRGPATTTTSTSSTGPLT